MITTKRFRIRRRCYSNKTTTHREIVLSDRSTDEEIIKSDNKTGKSEERDSPQYTSASSDDNEKDQHKNALSKGRKERRFSQSLIMDDSQEQRALKTYSASKSLINSNNWEPSSNKPSQASRITDSSQFTNLEQTKQGPKLKKNQSKKERVEVASRTNLDADPINESNKPLTRSRARVHASQNSQSIENNPPTTCACDCIIPTHAPAPSGSRLITKRFKKLVNVS